MPAAINAASVPSADALGARASSGSSGSGAAQEPRRREFSEVLRETSANSQTEKENSAATGERTEAAQDAEATARAGTETAQPAGEGKAPVEPSADQGADALAADALPAGGNELPPWLNIVAGSLPGAGTSPTAVAGANVDGSTPLTVVPAALDPVTTSAATAPVAGGKAPASPETALTGREASATRGGSPSAPVGPSAGAAHATVANEPLHPATSATGANAHGSELAASVAGETGAAADRAAATTTRFDTTLALAQTSPGSATTGQVTPSATASTTTTSIPLPLNHPHWQEAFASRVVWQVRDGLQQVNVAINPPELGPIEVRMSLQDDKVSAQFVTAHHAVRQVIEDAMPRLREMLSQSGLNLADANVFQQAPGRDGHAQQFAGGGNPGANDLAALEEDAVSPTTQTLRVGLVDAYV